MDKSHKVFIFPRSLRTHGPPISLSLITIIGSTIVIQPIPCSHPKIQENFPAPFSLLPTMTQHALHGSTRQRLLCAGRALTHEPRLGVASPVVTRIGHPQTPAHPTPAGHRLHATRQHVCAHNPAESSVAIRIKSIHHTELPKAHHVRVWALIPASRRSSHPHRPHLRSPLARRPTSLLPRPLRHHRNRSLSEAV